VRIEEDTMGQDEGKQAAAARAVRYVRAGTVIGLGTGSTAARFVDLLAQRIREERLDVRGVPTSEATARRARELGIPLADPFQPLPPLDLTVDGADEVDPGGDMIKGGGGALLREKLVALSSDRVLIMVDASKHVPHLGATFRLPVEVLAFTWVRTLDRLREAGIEPELRMRDGKPFLSDGGNYVADCRMPAGAPPPEELHRRLKLLPGVVETGLFLGLADLVVTGLPSGGYREQPFGRRRLAPLPQ
jgi:ribose 5-phosphate isomerase A